MFGKGKTKIFINRKKLNVKHLVKKKEKHERQREIDLRGNSHLHDVTTTAQSETVKKPKEMDRQRRKIHLRKVRVA